MTNLTPLMEAVITLATIIITSFLIPYLKSKLNASQREKLAVVIANAVAATEQIQSLASGAEKKNFVQGLLQAQGYDFDPNDLTDEINILIEAAVNGLKSE